METQEKISDSQKGLLDYVHSAKSDIINTTTTISQNNQAAIIAKGDELYKEYQDQAQERFVFFKRMSFATIGLLVLTIILLWVR